MDSAFINVPSEFLLGDVVEVTHIRSGEKYKGVISYLEMAPINRGVPNGDQTEYIYVKFEDKIVYTKWLSRGSPIMVQRKFKSIQKATIRTMTPTMTAANEGFHCEPEYPILPEDVDSMLIWRVAYSIQKL